LGLAPVASARDLVVARTATDRIVLDDRRADVNGGADRLRFADGRSLSVAALVQAMAAFGTPAGGERSLARADVQQYLTPLLAPGAQGAPGKAGRRGLAQRGNQPDSAPPSGRLPLAVPGPSPAPAGNGMRRHPTSGTGRVQW
jgi:hypothetical protein